MKTIQAVVLLLAASAQAVQMSKSEKRVSDDTAKIISDAVSSVVNIGQDPVRIHTSSETHHIVPVPSEPVVVSAPPKVVVVPQPVPYAVPISPAKAADAPAPHSSVMRAIASANEESAMEKVREQRSVADKLERLEKQAKINDAINDSVKREE